MAWRNFFNFFLVFNAKWKILNEGNNKLIVIILRKNQWIVECFFYLNWMRKEILGIIINNNLFRKILNLIRLTLWYFNFRI